MTDANEIYLLDYGAGNVLSIFNSLKEIGVHVKYIEKLEDFTKAKVRRPFFARSLLLISNSLGRKSYFLELDLMEQQ